MTFMLEDAGTTGSQETVFIFDRVDRLRGNRVVARAINSETEIDGRGYFDRKNRLYKVLIKLRARTFTLVRVD